MDDRFNTIAGWVLFSGIVALGLTSISSHFFSADKPHRPHEMGYAIEGVEEEGGADEGPALATLLAEADPARGESVFAKCVSCHTIDAGGANGIGPNLHGTMGKAVASHGGFAYSSGLKELGGTWTWEQMDAWLKSPKGLVSGTKMTFAGLGKAEDRAALMVYMNSQGSSLALPAAPEPAVEEPAEGEEAAEGEDAAAEEGAEAPAEEAAEAEAAE